MTSKIETFSSGRPWEVTHRHSRGVSYGGIFETSLTSPSDPDGSIIGKGDLYAQTVRCYEIILETMQTAGYTPEDLVCCDVWLLDTTQFETAARAHRDMVPETIRPVLSFIGCANFWHPDILVEVSVRAYK